MTHLLEDTLINILCGVCVHTQAVFRRPQYSTTLFSSLSVLFYPLPAWPLSVTMETWHSEEFQTYFTLWPVWSLSFIFLVLIYGPLTC